MQAALMQAELLQAAGEATLMQAAMEAGPVQLQAVL